MDNKEVKELDQKDVFSYIDKELKKRQDGKSAKNLQKTRSNFLIVVIVDIIAILVAVSGFYAVYNIFQERSYELVGTESITGMEDIIFRESESRSQRELEETRERMEDVESRLRAMEAEQAAVIARREQELRRELESRLQNVSAEERERIRRQYEQQIDDERKQIERQYRDNQRELERMQRQANENIARTEARLERVQLDFRKRIEEISNQMRLAEERAKREAEERIARRERELMAQFQAETRNLSAEEQEKLRREYEDKIRLERERISRDERLRREESDRILEETRARASRVEAQLEEQKKIDGFNHQVSVMFKQAIDNYKRGRYAQARANLANVTSLYNNKPADLIIPREKQDVDRFFVEAIGEYLTLKEQDASRDTARLRELALALEDLRVTASRLEAGTYNRNPSQAETQINRLRRSIPAVFEFYTAYDGFQSVIDDMNAEAKIRSANTDFNNRNYSEAVTKYLDILKSHPKITTREQVLNRLSTSVLASQREATPDIAALDRNARPVFDTAKNHYNAKEYDKAIDGFKRVLLQYPGSGYSSESVAYIENSYKAISDSAERPPAGVDLAKLKSEQTAQARTVFEDAQKSEKDGRYPRAKELYASLIIRYPLSDYVEQSVFALEGVINAQNAELEKKVREIGGALTDKAAGRVADIFGDEAILDIYRGQTVSVGEEILIFRSVRGALPFLVAEAKVYEVSPTMSKAKITSTVEEIRAGDLIYKK